MKIIAYIIHNKRFQSSVTLVSIFLLALAVRFHLRECFDFDGLYGQDAFAYFEYGQEVKAAVYALRTPGPMYWPLGFPIVLGIAFMFGGENAQMAQAVVLVLSALIPILAYAFVIEALPLAGWSKQSGRIAGLTSALILIFSGQLLQSSIVVMADVPALFWATLSLWALGRYLQTSAYLHRRKWMALAAFVLALATITRWLYGVLAVPFALTCVMGWRSHKAWQISASRNTPKYWRDGLIAVVLGGLILLPQLMHSRSNPVSVVDHAWLRDWNIKNAFETDFVTPDGSFEYDEPIAPYYARAAYDGWYLHPLFTVAAGAGFLILLWQTWRNRVVVALFVLLVGWAVMAYGFLAGIPYQNVRFSLAYILPLVILAGVGTAWVWVQFRKLANRLLLKPVSLVARVLVLLAVVVAAESPYPEAQNTVAWIVERKAQDYETVQWAAGVIPEGSTIYVLELWPMMRHYVPHIKTVQIYYETPQSMTQRLPHDQPAYVLLDMWAINHQWVGKTPAQIYMTIAEEPGLLRLGRRGNYSLYRVLE